jgi:hypothetical protein
LWQCCDVGGYQSFGEYLDPVFRDKPGKVGRKLLRNADSYLQMCTLPQPINPQYEYITYYEANVALILLLVLRFKCCIRTSPVSAFLSITLTEKKREEKRRQENKQQNKREEKRIKREEKK